ncbi:C-type lectin domain family 10 member A-like [Hemicordylus capensis]|uniref:C-type lectin domain family 10 member A-like n=1 Tax=Hemicordylus capensis TaxID=884348 RepID=UPI0023024020|nr:C-type lectin domain family 10 member A-like [Hemicordylus capensis]
MTAWCAGLMTIALVTTGSIVTGPKQSLQRIPRDDDSGEASTTSANLCPCTQGCCDNHWFQYKDACFLPVSQPQIWRQAEKNCKEEYDAHLASVHSQEENNFIFYLMGQQEEYWLGAWRTEIIHAIYTFTYMT